MTTVVDIANIFALSTNVGYYAEGVLFILIDLYLIEQCFCCYTAAVKYFWELETHSIIND